MPEKFSVVFFQRKPRPIHKSLEYIFEDVRNRMPGFVQPITKVFSHFSTGILPRLHIIWEAYKNQGDINHVTGDIHFSAILLERKKTLLTVLDCGMLSGSTGIKHQLLKYFWFTLPLKKCALVTVISSATKVELLRYSNYPESKIHVVPVAISPQFRHVPRTFSKRPVILQVGTTPNKNLERLVRALKGIDCHVNIIGSISEQLTELLKANNISYQSDADVSQARLVEYYINCDMVSFVSTYEGFGMPIVEANVVGRPVITSNLLSMPEVAGDAACLVNPFEVEEIKQGILKIVHDETYRAQLIENGLRNAKRFEPQRIAEQYLSLYLALRGKHQKP